MISSFTDNHRFLSNFYPCVIAYDGITYPSNEHYYVAMKTTDPVLRKKISEVTTAGKVKRFGRDMEIRADWEDVRLQVMLYGLRQKFSDPVLNKMLKDTGDAQLIEGNSWHDNFFGSCGCSSCGDVGDNHLGRLLMQVRSELC